VKQSRRQLFERLDRPALKALPSQPYEYADWGQVRVNIDYHVSVDEHLYSAPYTLIHETLWYRASHRTVELFYQRKTHRQPRALLQEVGLQHRAFASTHIASHTPGMDALTTDPVRTVDRRPHRSAHRIHDPQQAASRARLPLGAWHPAAGQEVQSQPRSVLVPQQLTTDAKSSQFASGYVRSQEDTASPTQRLMDASKLRLAERTIDAQRDTACIYSAAYRSAELLEIFRRAVCYGFGGARVDQAVANALLKMVSDHATYGSGGGSVCDTAIRMDRPPVLLIIIGCAQDDRSHDSMFARCGASLLLNKI